MECTTHAKPLLENMNSLVGPLLLIVAGLTILLLKTIKDRIDAIHKQRSSQMAFDLCDKFAFRLANAFEASAGRVQNMEPDGLRIDDLNLSQLYPIDNTIDADSYAKLKESYDSLKQEYLHALNEMDLFATPFVEELADEKTAYKMMSNIFLKLCTGCAVALSEERRTGRNDAYANIITLYEIWKQRAATPQSLP